jgi:hypothetical protein
MIITGIDIIARIVFATVSTITFAIALLTYSRFRTKKMALLTTGFAIFCIHGLISIPELFLPNYDTMFTDTLHLFLDATAILVILAGTLKD